MGMRFFLLAAIALFPVAGRAQLLSGPVPAGPGLAVSGNALSVVYGATAGTAAAGNDSRIVGAVQQNGAAALASLTAVNTGFNIPINGWDGSPQAAWGTTQGAIEYMVWRGGLAGNGAVLTTASKAGAGVNVNLNIAPQAGGQVIIGNAYGALFAFQPPSVNTNAYWIATSQASPAGVFLAAPQAGTINAGIAPSGAGAFTLAVPDGTATGGNARGAQAVDLQLYRTAATQVASGSLAFQAGGANVTGGAGTASFGYGQHANGTYGLDTGVNGDDRYRTVMRLHSLGYFITPGDDQFGETGLQGISTLGSAVRLTGDRATAGAKNCMNTVAKGTVGLRFMLVGNDYTTTGHHMAWHNEGMLTTDGTLGSAALLLGTPRVFGDTATVSLTADTTNGCINATVTPANSDTWHYVLRIDFTEVQ